MRLDSYIVTKEESFDNSEPIYNFPNLKKRLMDMGIQIGVANAWRSVGTIDVLPEDIGERIFFEDNGIFYIDDDGVKRRGFMYKKEYFFEWEGQVTKPKFHVCKCATIQSIGRENYRFANAEPVKVFSRNEGREVLVEGMELCRNCKNKMMEKEAKQIKNSTDFVEILKEAGEVEEHYEDSVDIFGYVKDWEKISLAYRTKKKFTCERCGTHIENNFDHFYMQTHHKNGKKTDNRESNLECLCIKCHSEVDETHRTNFSSRASKVVIAEYMRKYHSNY